MISTHTQHKNTEEKIHTRSKSKKKARRSKQLKQTSRKKTNKKS